MTMAGSRRATGGGIGSTAHGLFPEKAAQDLAVAAVRLALAHAGVDNAQVDFVGPIDDLVVGQRVEVAFTHLTDAVTLVNFKAG